MLAESVSSYEAYHNAFSQKGLSANRNEARKVEDAIFKSSDTKVGCMIGNRTVSHTY